MDGKSSELPKKKERTPKQVREKKGFTTTLLSSQKGEYKNDKYK